jgi:hypothetical protein
MIDLAWPIAADTTPVTIGAGRSLRGMTRLFDGYLRDVRLYTRALAPTELAALAR